MDGVAQCSYLQWTPTASYGYWLLHSTTNVSPTLCDTPAAVPVTVMSYVPDGVG